jgi:hypothetical protein
MSGYLKGKIYKRFYRFVANVVSGNAGIPKTILFVSICAVLLLAYVISQIYSGMLLEGISDLQQKRVVFREKHNTLISDYVLLTSRERISDYCKNVLGMVEADGKSLRRVAVELDDLRYPDYGEFAEKGNLVPEIFGRTAKGATKRK